MSEQINENRAWITLDCENEEYSIVPGSSTEIKLQVRNQGEETDYIEIGVRGIPRSWTTLSPQVVKLAPEEEAEITLTVQPPPPPETQAGVYSTQVVATSQQNPRRTVQVEVVLRVAVFETKGRIGVMMETVQFAVAPGSTVSIPILLLNQGLETDKFRFRVTGIPVNWVSTVSPVTSLEPGASKGIQLAIHPPQDPSSKAGRNPFTLRIASELIPEDYVEVNCILTIAAYTKYRAGLEPHLVEAGAPVEVMVENQGNIVKSFDLTWQSSESDLVFEAILPVNQEDQSQEEIQPEIQKVEPSTRTETEIIPIQGAYVLRVQPGKIESVQFRAKPVNQAILGAETSHEYSVEVNLSDKASAEPMVVKGLVTSRAIIPTWVLPVTAALFVLFGCFIIFMTSQAWNQNRRATETATYGTSVAIAATQASSATQTAAAGGGQQDSDGDGLTDSEEDRLGTDPFNPDTDRDELMDGQEVNEIRTDPLNPDSDADGLTDGDEVLRRRTDPLNPDTDADGLKDGDEVNRGTDPLNPDTDADGLSDGNEVSLGTDPLRPDTDGDGLLDGQETPPCPNPLDPDSDRDGIIDGRDLDPCNPNNPSLTATAVAGQPPTAAPPTEVPPTEPPPTEVPPTEPPPTAPPSLPSLPGEIAFSSNREGNFEIYVQNGADRSLVRLTNHPAVDTQPTWSPNGNRIAFTTHRDGNNEIYIMDANGSNPINISNHPGDDQFPTWSPDGGRVAFASNRDGNWEIYSVATDGSDMTNLTNNPANDFHPYWFRSSGIITGEEIILFATNRDGNFEIYRMNPDGTDLVNISNHPTNDTYPAASRQGRTIAFVSDRDGPRNIFLMGVNGDSPINLSSSGSDDLYPYWSPDDNWIIFASNRGSMDLYIIRPDGTSLTNFSNNPASEEFPAWR
jgi:hypothetical protein